MTTTKTLALAIPNEGVIMIQKLKSFLIGFLLIGVLGQPTLADMRNRDHGLSLEELAFVFGDPNADGFEILSPQEMAEIEGRWTWHALRQFLIFGRGGWSGIRAARSYIRTVRQYRSQGWHVKLMHHPGHHRFLKPGETGKGLYQKHWQVTRYRTRFEGTKKIKETVHEYFPYGPRSKFRESNPR